MNAGASIRLERTFAAPPERVFRAFTNPDEAVQWWGPPDVTTSAVEIDLRAGGRCRWVMHLADRTAVLAGSIVEVDPLHLLVMTNRWEGDEAETLVTLRFMAAGGGTRLELVHERLPQDVHPGEFERGWVGALDSLDAYLISTR